MLVNSSLYGSLKFSAINHTKATSAYYLGKSYNYDKFLLMVDNFANGLHHLGIKSDDVVSVCAPNTIESVVAFYAINKLGAIAHMVHPLISKDVLKENLKEVNSKCLIILNLSVETYEDIIKDGIKTIVINPISSWGNLVGFAYSKMNHCKSYSKYKNCYSFTSLLHKKEVYFDINHNTTKTAVLLNSGGSSGKPKVIKLSSYALNTLVNEGAEILNINVKDVEELYMLAVLPMFHGFGLVMGIHAMLMNGGAINIMPKFHRDSVIKDIKKGKINYLIGVPAIYEALLSKQEFNGDMLKNLKCCFIGGDFVAPSLIEKFNARMQEAGSSCRLFEGYGLTETVTVCCVNTFTHNKPNTVGKALNCVDIKIIDENNNVLPNGEVGEIVVSGTILMNGYLDDKNPFISIDGIQYVKTGDCGYLDEDNFLVFKQRIKRLLKVKGVNVYPSEVEKLVTNYSEVKQACLVSVKEDFLRLYIVLNDENGEHFDDRIRKDIQDKISVFALPKEIVYLKKMPQTDVTKINYKVLENYDFKEE